jgi:CheY-like chemotaxis protein
MPRRILLVDDEAVIRITLSAILSKHGFEVSAAATVAEALQKITSQQFEILLSDLNIGNPGDGLTALEAIRQQVDEYIVKPADVPALVNAIENKLATPPRQRQLPPPKRVAMVLQEHRGRIESLWLASVESNEALSRIALNKEQRLTYLRGILEQVIRAAQSYSGEETAAHKKLSGGYDLRRDWEGYTPSMMLAEFCMLRRVIAQIVQENLLVVNLSYLVPDLAHVNESLDEQSQAALVTLSDYIDASS